MTNTHGEIQSNPADVIRVPADGVDAGVLLRLRRDGRLGQVGVVVVGHSAARGSN